jgi:hypothetical protein
MVMIMTDSLLLVIGLVATLVVTLLLGLGDEDV